MDQPARYPKLIAVSAVSQTPTITWQHLGYTYDANGNLTTVQDNVASETLNYSYDALDRLTGVSGAYSQSYGYDATSGNLASLAGQTLSYTDTAHPHAATGLGSQAYSYDANGNMISRQIASGTYTLSYDAEGRLVGIASAGMSASYTYNGDGARVKAVVTTGSQVKTSAYVGDYFEISLGEPRQQSTPTQPDCSTNACIYLPLAATSRPELPVGQGNQVFEFKRQFTSPVWSADGHYLYGLARGKGLGDGYPAVWDLHKKRFKVCDWNLPNFEQIQSY